MIGFEDSQDEGSPQVHRREPEPNQLAHQGSQAHTGSFVDYGDNANDSSMQFPGGNGFLGSDQKIIDFNVSLSHQFENSKLEEDESDQLKKVLLQLR